MNFDVKKIAFFSVCVSIFLIMIILIIVSFFFINKSKNNIPECKHGYIGRFQTSCTCYYPNVFFGKYCDEMFLKSCTTNNDCPSKYFCLSINDKGRCYKASYSSLKINKTFALSESIMTQNNASSFCFAIGNGYRPAMRKDFNCNKKEGGVACLDKNLVIKLRDKFGSIGFFWLEEIENSNNAYYADFADGIVYNTEKNNSTTSRVLCIKEN